MASTFRRNSGPRPISGNSTLAELCRPRDLLRARQWGLAIRAAQRLSGGIRSVLDETRLQAAGPALNLLVPAKQGDLVNEGVLRRLSRLAAAMELKPRVTPA